jgi:hypothetical protein
MSEKTTRLSLPLALAAWGKPDFSEIFKHEAEQLDPELLPLQQGLSGTSDVADEPFRIMLIGAAADTDTRIRVKAGVFYAGILGGCSCADDPTPLESQPEYCVLWFDIDKTSAATRVSLVEDD